MKQSLTLAALASVTVVASIASADQDPVRKPVDYQREVRPILSGNCFACHGPDESSREADLRLDERDDAVRLRDDDYQIIVPGDAEASELIFRVTDTVDPMPPEKHGHALSDEQIDILTRWIEEGAEYTPHWSFLPIERPTPPSETEHPMDAFVRAQLAEAGLTPAEEADRHTLIRRLSLDLIGLPPTQQEVLDFVHDDRPDAYERAVDRLLASPHYGERWAAVWLDLARYADSKGHGSDPLREIWRWRDWVIEAYNADMPYDQFTLEQMAGDLLPDADVNTRLATAFHRNSLVNTEGGTDNEEFRVAAVKDRTNLSMQVWMGLTFGCAECHTHKFDPITHEDYYSTFAIFNQTADQDNDNDAPKIPTPTRAQQEELRRIDAGIASVREEIASRPIDAEALTVWESEQAQSGTIWELPIEPMVSTAGEEQRYNLFDDGSWILREGLEYERGPLEIRSNTQGDETALQIEALTHERLPRGGPGGSGGNGNFVLSELRVVAVPVAKTPVRYVRLSLDGEKRILSLAEVQVMAGGVNVALQGKASQSSTSYEGPAELAIDGNTDGRFEQASVTHTATESNPWWEVELADAVWPDELSVWTRTDSNLFERLRGLRVELLDVDRKRVAMHWQEDPAKTSFAWNPTAGGQQRILSAEAGFEQEGWTAAMALDGNPSTGWAIAPQQGRSHELRVHLEPSGFAAQTVVQIDQNYGGGHVLGRFRPQWTRVKELPPMLPAMVRVALAKPRDQRTEGEQQRVEDYFRGFDPETLRLQGELAALEKERKDLRIPTTPVLVALAEDKQRTTHILEAGSFLNPADEVQARIPEAFTFSAASVSNRLEFAKWLTHPDNPLTPRVAVNRIWSRIFGRGIVLTEEDFGAQGSLPTHPELLEWLAAEFRSHWSQKQLLKTIVMSATYRQASTVTPEKLESDPDNVLLSRGARFRLPAEAVRDQALVVSGLLSRKMFGPSVFPPQPEGLWQAAFNGQRNWQTDTDEDRWRRGVYVFWRRSTPYPSMTVFDAPSREICTIRRIRTNTPLQAFVTLNDPVYVEAAQALARKLLKQRFSSIDGGADRVRLRMGLEWTMNRPADPRAVEVLERLLNEQRAVLGEDVDDARALASEPLGMLPDGADPVEYAAWTVIANVLLNQDSFLTRD